ncbi:MAG TPA: phosphoribosylaminoimidazolesuccinocarboxamide synthase [Candidatus Xenobia bacterium]|jgi:phosphoribosylaminoimidazole-succinocarboxamide synthase
MVIAEGKTKIVKQHPTQPDQVLIESKDDITAGDGARHDVLAGKGRLATRTTCNVFRYLEAAGLDTAFIEKIDGTTFVARRCTMVPLEVVIRRLATGSYLKRRPDLGEGFRFDPPLVELFFKDDARHDPLMSREEVLKAGLLDSIEMEQVVREGRQIFIALEMAWARQKVTLVDLKVEFGRIKTRLFLADVIDNDSWRLWPGGDKSQMKDKQVYRNLQERTPEALAQVLENYRWVADATDRFIS